MEQPGEQFDEPKITKDENEFLFLEDVIDQLPTTNITLVSLSLYLKLTGQSTMWANIANNIIFQLIECCKTPMLSFRVSVENVFNNPKKLSDNLRLLRINNISDLDSILKQASNWGENIIYILFNEIFEDFLKGATSGTFDYLYNSYDILTFIIIYSKREEIADNSKILEYVRLPFDKKIILKIIKET